MIEKWDNAKLCFGILALTCSCVWVMVWHLPCWLTVVPDQVLWEHLLAGTCISSINTPFIKRTLNIPPGNKSLIKLLHPLNEAGIEHNSESVRNLVYLLIDKADNVDKNLTPEEREAIFDLLNKICCRHPKVSTVWLWSLIDLYYIHCLQYTLSTIYTVDSVIVYCINCLHFCCRSCDVNHVT